MRKKTLAAALAFSLVFSLTACGKEAPTTNVTPTEAAPTATPVVESGKEETFSAEYEMKGTTSSGAPKNDTFIFEGTTTDGIITELNFDIIRNKGTESEYSKKDIMGYLMNISDAVIEKDGENFKLSNLSANGYDTAYGEGNSAQFMVSASIDVITDETTFKELTFTSFNSPVELEKALIAYKSLAREAGIEDLNGDTLVKDIISAHGLYKDGAFVEGTKRVSFAGPNGGRSYGEQINAIVDHILNEKMTLEEVYEMFKTVNQIDVPISERDAITGATISFVSDFQRMVYIAMHGEVFEGVVTHTTADDATVVEVVTQGFGGEIETHVTFDSNGQITDITIRDASETEAIGGLLTADNSEFIQAIIAGQNDIDSVDTVSGATITANSLKKAVSFAIDYFK